MPQLSPLRPDRDAHAILPFDQSADRFPRPKIKRQSQLIGRVVGNRSADPIHLSLRQPFAERTSFPLRRQDVETPVPGLLDPDAHGLAGDAEDPRGFKLSHAIADGLNGAASEFFFFFYTIPPL